MTSVTFVKAARGEFDSFVNGVKTKYSIHNGCLGLSGKDTPNIYVVSVGDNPTKIMGTLQMCKKSIKRIIERKAELMRVGQ